MQGVRDLPTKRFDPAPARRTLERVLFRFGQ
jgi:hypothetical protein